MSIANGVAYECEPSVHFFFQRTCPVLLSRAAMNSSQATSTRRQWGELRTSTIESLSAIVYVDLAWTSVIVSLTFIA